MSDLLTTARNFYESLPPHAKERQQAHLLKRLTDELAACQKQLSDRTIECGRLEAQLAARTAERDALLSAYRELYQAIWCASEEEAAQEGLPHGDAHAETVKEATRDWRMRQPQWMERMEAERDRLLAVVERLRALEAKWRDEGNGIASPFIAKTTAANAIRDALAALEAK